MCLINVKNFFYNKKEVTRVSREENLKKYLKNFWFLGQTDKKEATSNYLKFIANGIQCELNLNYYNNNFTYRNLEKYIRYSFLLDMESEDITYKRKIDISNTPVISMVWNDSLGECIFDIGKCNGNPFSIDRVGSNIKGIMIDPIGLVFVYNGNHSVNAAIVHNEGNVLVEEYVDITPMIDKYRFNGTRFVSIKDNAPIVNNWLLDKSMPFTYSMGVMFELGRIINKNKHNEI